MAQVSKITFSREELQAITDPEIFYRKHAILKKVMALFGETAKDLDKIVSEFPELNQFTNVMSPKIFRGENYKLLPYMVLDHPRKFSAETIFAFRSMFWWGKEFSFTLHLQGEALRAFGKNISEKINSLRGNDFYWCVNSTPWQYYFEKDNYILLDEIPESEINLQEKDFIKLSRKIPVNDFENVPETAASTFALLVNELL